MSDETRSQIEATSAQSSDRTPSRRTSARGTSLVAAAAIGGVDKTQVARAQQPAAPSGQRPNILVIWGDDVGIANISAYSFGLMGTRRRTSTVWPGRIDVHRLLCRAEMHGRPRHRSSPVRRPAYQG
jgi:hypothetical protein